MSFWTVASSRLSAQKGVYFLKKGCKSCYKHYAVAVDHRAECQCSKLTGRRVMVIKYLWACWLHDALNFSISVLYTLDLREIDTLTFHLMLGQLSCLVINERFDIGSVDKQHFLWLHLGSLYCSKVKLWKFSGINYFLLFIEWLYLYLTWPIWT